MYRLLIVDDEAGHREGLLGLLCMLKPDYLVFEAENGERALQMMNMMMFDLVLTDIRMPGMDGITFLSIAREKQPHARFAILSAYGIFEYAKQGLALGADDYLLKPVDEDELNACLNKMENHIEAKRLIEQEQAKLQSNLQDMQSSYIEQQMYRFVMGDLSTQEETAVRKSFGNENAGAIIYIKPESQWSNGEIRNALRARLKMLFKTLGTIITFSPMTDYTALANILVCEERKLAEIREILEELAARLKGLGETIYIGFSCASSGILARKLSLYHCARRACLRHFFESSLQVIEADPDTPYNPFQSIRLDVRLSKVIAHIREGDFQAAYERFEASLQTLTQDRSVYPSQVKEAVMYALIFATGSPDLKIDEEIREQMLAKADVLVMESMCYNDMLTGLRNLLKELCEIIRSDQSEKASPMDEALSYVRKHYCKDITLTSVADHFHYNPSYFSLQFKRRAGVAFSEYLYDLRMKKAVDLLIHTDQYASQVGTQVGYPNAAYFTKAFKKKYGVSPDQYRKQGRRT